MARIDGQREVDVLRLAVALCSEIMLVLVLPFKHTKLVGLQ